MLHICGKVLMQLCDSNLMLEKSLGKDIVWKDEVGDLRKS